MKRFLAALLVGFTLVSLSCAPAFKPGRPADSKPKSETSLKSYTLSELKRYDGRNGRRAYVGVNGFIYDVTDEPFWKNGRHQSHTAGTDLSKFMNQSPHGTSILEDYLVVGKLEEANK